MSNSQDLVFVAAQRTPFGTFGGSLAQMTPTDMGVVAGASCLKKSGVQPNDLDAVVVGNVVQATRDAIYVSRHIGLKLGIPQDRPALTVNRLCGSGFEALIQAAYLIRQDGARAVLAGGTESMSLVPYVDRKARFGHRMGHGELEDFLTASLTDEYVNLPMAMTAENLAVSHGISREAVDSYSLESQIRARDAWEKGCFRDEVTSVTLASKKGTLEFAKDEHFRGDSTLEGLQKLKPLFKKDGVVTAGTASGICDGAAFLILTTREHAKKNQWPVLGRLAAWGVVGCDPKVMGIGPVAASRLALERYQKLDGSKVRSINNFDLFEVNEAFAAQYLAVEKDLGLDRKKTNAEGGAIALGHPLAASGARITAHLLHALARRGGGVGLGSACIGGGQGISVIVEV